MIRKHIKCVTAIIMLLVILLIPKNIYAANNEVVPPKISCDSVVTTPKSTVDVPVYVSNNPGIMGLGLEVSYDDNVLEILEVKAGEVLSEGTLNDSIGTADSKGKVKILWSSTKEVKADGELVLLSFEAKNEGEGSSDIKLYCSTADTFNENWEDVSFKTENATVRVQAEITEEYIEEYIEESDITASSKKEAGTEKESQNIETESTQSVSTETAKSETSVGQTDVKQATTQQKKELTRVKKAVEIKSEVEEKSDTKTAKAEIEKVLKEYNAETPNDVKEEDKQKFTQRVSAVLYQEDIHIDDVLENETTDGKIEVLTALYDDLSEKKSVEQAEKQVLEAVEETGKTKVSVRYVIGLVILVVVAILVVVLRGRKFKKGEKKDERNK